LNIGFNDAEPSLRIGATLSFNLFDGFQRKIQTQNAKIQQKNRELTWEETRLNLEKEVISAYESYQNSLLVLDLEKKYLEAADLNFKRTRELYNLGQVTTTQFREAQLNLIRSRSSVSTAKYEAKIKEIELLRLTGQLIQ
jgi:outer membrane protein